MIAGQLEIDFTTNVAKITNDVSTIKGSFTGAAREMQAAINQVKNLLGTLGAGISVKEIVDFTGRTIDAIARMKDLAEIGGTTAQAFSKFEAPVRLAGSSLDQTATAMARVSKAAVEAFDPASMSAQAFTAIGISTKQLRSLAPDQLFELIARQLGHYSDGIQKNAVMQQLLGRAGAQMSGTMKQIAETTELHASVTQEDADKAKALEESWTRLKIKGDTFWRSLASDAIPVLTQLSDKLQKSTIADSALEHMETTFKSRINAMHDAFNNLGSFKDVLLVMLGIDTPASVAARQLANQGGTTGPNFASGKIVPAGSASGSGALAPPGFDPAAIAAMKAALAERQRMLELDNKGWVAYVEEQQQEYEDALRQEAKDREEFFSNEEKLRQQDLQGWVAYAQAQIDDYEQSLKDLGDKQPSFFEASQKQWKGYIDGVEGGFRDAWNSFADGSGNAAQAAKSALKRTLFDWIYQQFAKPIILQIVASVGGSLGLTGLANAATSANGGTSLTSSGTSLLGNYMGGTFGTVAGGFAGGAAIGSIGASAFGNQRNQLGMQAGGAIGGAAGAYIGMQYGAAFGPIGMIVGALIGTVLGSLIKSGGGPKQQGAFAGAFDSAGSLSSILNGADITQITGDNQNAASAQTMVQALGTSFSQILGQLGGHSAGVQLGLGYSADPKGTAPSFIHGVVRDAQGNVVFQQFNDNASRDPTELQNQISEETQRMLVAALKASDLPPAIAAIFKDVDPLTSSLADLQGALDKAQISIGLLSVNAKGLDLNALQAWQRNGETLDQTFQRVIGQLADFDNAFSSDAVKLQQAHDAISGAFKDLGMAAPATTEEFYKLVHGLDLSTESGRSAFDALMKIAPAFQSVQQAGVAMTSALTSALSTLGNTGFGRSMTQGSLSDAASQFRATHGFAAGWSDAQLVQQLQTISPSDWANYLANDPSGASLITTILTAAASLAGSATPAATSFAGSVNNAASAAQNLAQALAQGKASLGDYLDSLLVNKSLSPLSPADQEEAARQKFVKDMYAANSGDLGALQALQGDSTTYLGLARANHGSTSQYQDIFTTVFNAMAGIASVPDYNTRMLDIQTQQQKTMSDAVAVLTTVSQQVVAVGNKISAAVGDSGDRVAAAISSAWAAR